MLVCSMISQDFLWFCKLLTTVTLCEDIPDIKLNLLLFLNEVIVE